MANPGQLGATTIGVAVGNLGPLPIVYVESVARTDVRRVEFIGRSRSGRGSTSSAQQPLFADFAESASCRRVRAIHAVLGLDLFAFAAVVVDVVDGFRFL
jgi:hypothetical protein